MGEEQVTLTYCPMCAKGPVDFFLVDPAALSPSDPPTWIGVCPHCDMQFDLELNPKED